jgi:signal transduction histidine kinase
VTVYVLVAYAAGVRNSQSPPWYVNVSAIAVIAATLEPVRRWLRPRVEDLLDPEETPYEVISRVQTQLGSGAPRDMVPTIAQSIAHTLGLPYVEIEAEGEPDAGARYGEPPSGVEPTELLLAYHGEAVGRLRVAPGGRAGLAPADLRLLGDLAQQVGIALHAARASRVLLESRAALVAAREEERRRIRRDLHDGLGPTLASLRLQLAAARRLLPDDPHTAATLIDELQDEVRSTTAEVRRLVYDLRPPLLDEFGLVGALRTREGRADGLDVRVEAPDDLPPLAAAVEVALFRIATEALHNIARHASASTAAVRITMLDNDVVLTVVDDGRGLPDPVVPGVGLTAMGERAAELGGRASVAAGEEGGTVVTAVLPWQTGAR